MKIAFSLTQLEYILAVYRTGHFAKAAAQCHVTQPTLSMQIQKFEQTLGAPLFDRSKKPVLLTAAGERVIHQIQSVLQESKKIQDLVQGMNQGAVKGQLNFALIPTLAPYVLPLLLPFAALKYPGLHLRIFEMQTNRILDALEHDEVDVGLMATPVERQQFFELPLYYEPFYVVCQKNHALAKYKKVHFKNLTPDDIWLLEEGHCLRNQVIDICSFKKLGAEAQPYSFESGNIETLKSLVDSFGGYTFIPELAVNGLGKNSSLISFERPIPAREVGLVYRRTHYKNQLIETLGEAILGSIPEKIRRLRKKDLEVIPINS